MLRGVLALMFALLPTAWALAEEPLRVLPAELDGAPAGGMMHRSLLREADRAFAAWREEYETRDTAEEIADYQRRMREEFLERIGGVPERGPLNAEVTGAVERDGFRVEKILFESRPRRHVTAALFLPDAERHRPPYPGVLVVCGHSAEGKANEGYQTASALLALNGIAALIVDPIGQGERYQILKEDGTPEIPSSTTEHTLVGLGSILLGRNTATVEIHDGMRAIDYLQSREDIDPERIGCMGNSGGGTQTAYLMALDERIRAASPSCYITSFERLLNTIGPQDAEQNIFGQIALGMDHADYLMMRAPTPILVCCATRDFFDVGGTWQSFRAAKRLYARLGHAERIDLAENDDTHGYKRPLREVAVRWMLRWLAGRDEAITEPPIKVLSREEIQVTPRGQVLLLEGEQSVFAWNEEENERLAGRRREVWRSPETALKQVREVAGIRPLDKLPEPRVESVAVVRRDNLETEKLILEPEPGILLPAVRVRALNAKKTGPAVLYLDESGKSEAAAAGGEVERLAHMGHVVLAVDVRGVGETRPEKATWYDKRFGIDGRDVMIAYLLGQSYVGMRAEDVLVCARWLRRESGAPVRLIATGHLGTPALHAAALEPELFGHVTLRRPLVSWSSLVATPVTEDQLVHVVHGALKAYDLPDLAGVLGERIEIHDARDAAGDPADKD